MNAGTCIGWDIGGAHLKVARLGADGAVLATAQYATPLWQGLQSLHGELEKFGKDADLRGAHHALTMTGELVDLFPNRRAGVDALLHAFSEHFSEGDTSVFAGREGFLPVATACSAFESVASANWMATTLCAATRVAHGMLVDIGTTTTDIIPITNHRLCNHGWNDQDRLAGDELVYTGIVRTPVMALVQRLPCGDRWQNVAAEHFATSADIYRITGELDERADLYETADGRGKTVAESMARLARMLGAEVAAGETDRWTQVASHVAEQQLLMIERAFQNIRGRLDSRLPVTIVGAGAGAFLARKLARRQQCEYLEFAELFVVNGISAHDIATCAPAVAVADLSRRRRLQ